MNNKWHYQAFFLFNFFDLPIKIIIVCLFCILQSGVNIKLQFRSGIFPAFAAFGSIRFRIVHDELGRHHDVLIITFNFLNLNHFGFRKFSNTNIKNGIFMIFYDRSQNSNHNSLRRKFREPLWQTDNVCALNICR